MRDLTCDDCKFSGRCGNGELHFRNRGYVCHGFAARNINLIKPTNGDRIRSMSDEELAVTLMCPNEMGVAEIPCDHSDDKNCCRCLLDWLRQPAKEQTHD